MPPFRYVVIIGCGRLGSILASQLNRLGCNVVVIDREESAFRSLASDFSGFSVIGDAAERTTLQQAKVDQADCVLAITHNDNLNLMVAQAAKVVYGIPKVIARVFDPSREAIYHEFEIETICPTRIIADAFMKELLPSAEAGK